MGHPAIDADVQEVVLQWPGVSLGGLLGLPATPAGLVMFAHGSGSSRFSPRNNAVARHLRSAGFGTLLFDLLTTAESDDRANVFDIGLLADRLAAATRWAQVNTAAPNLPIGYFGASTGAAAALAAAAALPGDVAAVVSRGGRPDLAAAALDRVRAPTLLIVGARDDIVLGLNRSAFARLTCPKEMLVVPGATHLFEEPGTLKAVMASAAQWFAERLVTAG
jgi:putative phosphoribosyl transferase